MSAQHVEDLRDQGFAIVRGFLDQDQVAAVRTAVDAVYEEGVKHHATYRDKNLCFEILNDPEAMKRVMVQAYWFAWINPVMEAQRRHPRYLEILEPLLGPSIKQIANQIHWKPPGAKYSSYRFHQDLRFRERPDVFTELTTSYFTTALAINRVDAENGALCVFPGSHKRGYLGLGDDHEWVLNGQDAGSANRAEAELRAAGLDPDDAVVCELEPGDLVIWTLLTVHGSGSNRSDRDRPLILNSYVRADNSPERGEWAFRDGVSTPLGPEPQICRFEDLHEHPEPFYNDADWTGEQPALS